MSSNLQGVDLQVRTCSQSQRSKFAGANLSQADLQNSTQEANLEEADLRGAGGEQTWELIYYVLS